MAVDDAEGLTAFTRAQSRPLIVVIDTLDVGGTELQLAAVLSRLIVGRRNISVITLVPGGAVANQLRASGVVVITPPAGYQRGSALDQFFARATRVLWLGWTLSNLLLRQPASIVYTVLPFASALAGPIALLYRRRLIVGRRSRNFYRKHLPLIIRSLESLAIRCADALVPNSEAVAADLIMEGAKREAIVVIPNGIDAVRCVPSLSQAASRVKYQVAEGSLVILVLANLFPYKGHTDLIEALAGLAQMGELPVDWYVLFAGRDPSGGDQLRQLQERCASCGIARNTKFLGAVENVGDIFQIADIFVLPSHEEGLSNALLEAMLAGVPIVATDVGGNRDALEGGAAGLLVCPRNPQALARAIARLVEEPLLRQTLALRAQKRAENEYSLSKSAARFADLLNRIEKMDDTKRFARAHTSV